MSDKAFRVGVAGVGAIGRNHARVMAEIAAASGGKVEFSAIYDVDQTRAAELAAQFNTTAVSDLAAFSAKVDAATVAVPTIFHKEVGGHLLEHGKHVLIEKPISDSLDEAQWLVNKANDAGLILQVGHIERFNPVMRQLEERMNNPRFIEAHRLSPFPNRSMDIGVVLDVMKQIETHLLQSHYDGFLRKGRIRGRFDRLQQTGKVANPVTLAWMWAGIAVVTIIGVVYFLMRSPHH